MCIHAGRVSLTAHGSSTAGESYSLQCSVGESQTTFEWLRGPLDGRTPIANSSSLTITFNSSSSQMHFRPLQQSHNGSYSCRAIAGEDTLLSQPIGVHAKGKLFNTVFLKRKIVVLFSFQVLPYQSKSLSIPEELLEKVLTLRVGRLELKILGPLSLINGLKTAVVVRYMLEKILALSPSIQFDYLMLLIIHVW